MMRTRERRDLMAERIMSRVPGKLIKHLINLRSHFIRLPGGRAGRSYFLWLAEVSPEAACLNPTHCVPIGTKQIIVAVWPRQLSSEGKC